jgi:hypothetical protein
VSVAAQNYINTKRAESVLAWDSGCHKYSGELAALIAFTGWKSRVDPAVERKSRAGQGKEFPGVIIDELNTCVNDEDDI